MWAGSDVPCGPWKCCPGRDRDGLERAIRHPARWPGSDPSTAQNRPDGASLAPKAARGAGSSISPKNEVDEAGEQISSFVGQVAVRR